MEGSETAAQAAKQTQDSPGSTYVVQRKGRPTTSVTSGGSAGWEVFDEKGWTDIATVTVPKRTQRSTIVTRALAEALLTPTSKDRFRILDEEAHGTFTVQPKEQPAPEYEIVPS
jgi:hypothetical protein